MKTKKENATVWRIRIPVVAAWLLFTATVGAGCFVAGYGLCFNRVVDIQTEHEILKANARRIEEELVMLHNGYAVLSGEFIRMGKNPPLLSELTPIVIAVNDSTSIFPDSIKKFIESTDGWMEYFDKQLNKGE